MRNLTTCIAICSILFSCGKDATTQQNGNNELQISQSRGISKLSSESESLITAIKDQDRILVKTALANQADPNYLSYKGQRPIVLASKYGDAQIVETLISRGADPNLTDKEGNYALIEAVKNNNLGALKSLLPKIDNINVIDENNEGALVIALKRKNQGITNFLIKNGIQLNVKDRRGKRPIDIASNKDLRLSYQLIKNVNVIQRKGIEQNRIINFIEDGAYDTLDYIARFHDLKASLKGLNYILAILKIDDKINQTKILRLLLENKVDANGEEDSVIPIIATSKAKNLYATRLLFQYGANLNLQDSENMTAMGYAAKNLDVKLVNFLYAYGALVEYTYVDYKGKVRPIDICRMVPKPRYLAILNKDKSKKIRSRMACD